MQTVDPSTDPPGEAQLLRGRVPEGLNRPSGDGYGDGYGYGYGYGSGRSAA